jgi:hypothetical protein
MSPDSGFLSQIMVAAARIHQLLVVAAGATCAASFQLPRAPTYHAAGCPPHLAPHMGPVHGRLPGFSAATASAIAAVIQPGAAVAAADTDGLPPDSLVVGFALLLLVLTGLLNLSLGDIIADEAQLPSSTNLINKSRQRRSSFIKGGK